MVVRVIKLELLQNFGVDFWFRWNGRPNVIGISGPEWKCVRHDHLITGSVHSIRTVILQQDGALVCTLHFIFALTEDLLTATRSSPGTFAMSVHARVSANAPIS